jgi:magnesium chelatase subunit I
VNLLQDISDKQYEASLQKVDGLKELVKSKFPHTNNKEQLLLMEFVLHGLAAYSLISKKLVENETRFSDLLGTMMNFSMGNEEQEEDTF